MLLQQTSMRHPTSSHALRRALTRLDASHNELSSLPEGLWKLVGLLELNLGHNKLSEIAGEIVQLSALQVGP